MSLPRDLLLTNPYNSVVPNIQRPSTSNVEKNEKLRQILKKNSSAHAHDILFCSLIQCKAAFIWTALAEQRNPATLLKKSKCEKSFNSSGLLGLILKCLSDTTLFGCF